MTGYPSIDKPWLKYYDEGAADAPLPKCTMYEYVLQRNVNRTERVALDYFGRKITYGTLFERVDEAARAFWRAGIREGDVVIICSVTTPETIYALYGLNRIGAIANMVDPRTSAGELHQYVDESNARAVMTIDVALPKIEQALEDSAMSTIIVTSPTDSLPPLKKVAVNLANRIKRSTPAPSECCVRWNDFVAAAPAATPKLPPHASNRCAVIVHTGGTTGKPKGVMLSNENLNAAAFQCISAGFDFKPDQSWLNIMPPFIAYGVGNGLHLPLIVGMEVILVPSFDPDKFDELLVRHHPNHMVGVPSHYGSIVESRRLYKADLSWVIAPTVGGDAMDVALETRVNEFLHSHGCAYDVVKGYGMTEVCAAVSACVSNEANRLGSVGIPLTHTTIAIFDPESGRELPYGEIGEVCMTGPNTMIGYWENPKATSAILHTHDDGLVWVHSGDLGRIDEDGLLFIVDRMKRMIIRYDGFKVFPSIIERVIGGHPAVGSCCIVGVRDEHHTQGMLPVAFVVPASGADRDAVRNELAGLCSEGLPEYAQPTRIEFVDTLPLTPIGKIDYRELERRAQVLAGKA